MTVFESGTAKKCVCGRPSHGAEKMCKHIVPVGRTDRQIAAKIWQRKHLVETQFGQRYV